MLRRKINERITTGCFLTLTVNIVGRREKKRKFKRAEIEEKLAVYLQNSGILERISEVEAEYAFKNKVHLRFRSFKKEGKHISFGSGLSANAGYRKSAPIRITFDWVPRILHNSEDPELLNALSITIGHEMSHKINDYPYLKAGFGRICFAAQTNEVYNDYFATKVFADNDKGAFKRSVEYKSKPEEYLTESHCDDVHPTPYDRIKYVNIGSYDASLLRLIAEDAGVSQKVSDDLIADIIQKKGMISLNE